MEDVDALLADLAMWTADLRAHDAAESRIRERWLRQQAEEDARFSGLALDLAEAGSGVSLGLTSGRTLHGHIATVAADFCVLRHDGRAVTLLAFSAIATLRPEPGAPSEAAASRRVAQVEAHLDDVLVGLAVERPRVRLVVAGAAEAVAGELRSVGSDVVTIRLGNNGRAGTVYVQLGSVREVTLLG